MEKDIFNRRNFIKKSARAVALGAVGTLAVQAIDIEKLIASQSQCTEDKEWKVTKVIKISDYPALGSVGGNAMITNTVIVIRTGNSKFAAINTVCTHKKCDVDFTGSGFECPCHGSTFNKSGKVLTGPAKKNLKTYSTTYNEAEGTLTINM